MSRVTILPKREKIIDRLSSVPTSNFDWSIKFWFSNIASSLGQKELSAIQLLIELLETLDQHVQVENLSPEQMWKCIQIIPQIIESIVSDTDVRSEAIRIHKLALGE